MPALLMPALRMPAFAYVSAITFSLTRTCIYLYALSEPNPNPRLNPDRNPTPTSAPTRVMDAGKVSDRISVA